MNSDTHSKLLSFSAKVDFLENSVFETLLSFVLAEPQKRKSPRNQLKEPIHIFSPLIFLRKVHFSCRNSFVENSSCHRYTFILHFLSTICLFTDLFHLGKIFKFWLFTQFSRIFHDFPSNTGSFFSV